MELREDHPPDASTDVGWFGRPDQPVVRQLADMVPGHALNLGCGDGSNAVWLAARGWEVTALDGSEVGIEKARRRARGRGLRVDWVAADVATHQLWGLFDLVLMVRPAVPASVLRIWLDRARQAMSIGATMLYLDRTAENPTVQLDEIVAALPGFQVDEARVGGCSAQDGAPYILVRAVKIDSGHL